MNIPERTGPINLTLAMKQICEMKEGKNTIIPTRTKSSSSGQTIRPEVYSKIVNGKVEIKAEATTDAKSAIDERLFFRRSPKV